jgi:hypothetical protein
MGNKTINDWIMYYEIQRLLREGCSQTAIDHAFLFTEILHPCFPFSYILIYRNDAFLFTILMHCYLPILMHCYLPITHMALQPKALVKKFRILLFPEQDAKLFYKIVFGRWFMWMAVMFFCYHTYSWAIYRENVNREVAIETAKASQKVAAWDYLYNFKSKQLHKMMDSALAEMARR